MVRQYLILAYNILQIKQLTAAELSNPTVFNSLVRMSKRTDAILEAIKEDVLDELLASL